MSKKTNIEFLDVEYLIREYKNNKCILSVQSRSNNCSCHVRITDEWLKKEGIKGLIQTLNKMKEHLIYSKINNIFDFY